MSDSENWKGNVANLLNNIYCCADKSSWYGKVTDAYDRTRPRYPSQLLQKAKDIAGLEPGARVLEVGAGPGIATLELAKLGLNISAIEPNSSACQLAKTKCADYPLVDFFNSTFEEWDLVPEEFAAIFATTSFHWVDPKIRCAKTAEALKPGGHLVLLWNTPPQPSDRILESLESVYQVFAPELSPPESISNHLENIGKFAEEMMNSGYYQNLVSDSLISQVTYSVDDYLTLLTTLSPYIGLSEEKRDNLLAALRQELRQNYGESLDLSYLSIVQIGLKS